MRIKMLKGLLAVLTLCAVAGAGVLTAVCVCAGRTRTASPADCIIVLGARVWPDGRLSTALLHRCERALEAWNNGLAPAVIACGGQGGGEPVAEGDAMRGWLMDAGIPGDRVIAETKSVNTVENLRYAREIMEENGWKSAVVVTNDYHVERALWIARDVGVRATALAAPSPDTLGARTVARLRESVSWVLYAVRRL